MYPDGCRSSGAYTYGILAIYLNGTKVKKIYAYDSDYYSYVSQMFDVGDYKVYFKSVWATGDV